ncbi:MAG: LacI family DNA-binding transcriptional regulator [Kiloniellales bacterium]
MSSVKTPPTIRTVAARAEVSVATVSRVVNGLAPPHSPATQRVREAIKELGFRPNRLGRGLKTARSSTIGLVIPSLANPVFAGSVQGVQAAARAAGYGVLLTATNYDKGEEAGAVETLLSHYVDGLVLTVAKSDDSELLDELDERQVPYVLVYNQPSVRHRAAVTVDNVAAAREVVELLKSYGHHRIGMVAGQFCDSDRARLRWLGYDDAMLRAGLEPDPVIEVAFEATDLTQEIRDALTVPEPPTALFCSTDLIAVAVMGAATRLGLEVPRDLSVVGFDGIAMTAALRPQLTTIVQPTETMGREAFALLAKLMTGGEEAESLRAPTLLSHNLRRGETVGPARAGKPKLLPSV